MKSIMTVNGIEKIFKRGNLEESVLDSVQVGAVHKYVLNNECISCSQKCTCYFTCFHGILQTTIQLTWSHSRHHSLC